MTLAVFGTMGGTSLTEPVTFTGAGTTWLSAMSFSITGTGNSIGTPTATDDTHATATITCGSTNGPFTITDSTTGATCTFTIATARTYDLTDPSIYGHSVQIEGGLSLSSLSGTTCWNDRNSLDAAVRFRASCAQIDFFMLVSGGANRLSIDRVDQHLGSSQLIPGHAAFGWWCHSTGLDAATEHEYLCWWGSANSTRGNPGVTQVRVFGGTGINTNPIAARPLVIGPGDSVGTGAGITGGGYANSDTTVGFWHDLGLSDYQVANHSEGSQPISRTPTPPGPTGTEAYTTGETALIVAPAPAPAVVYVLSGVVDVLRGFPTGQFATDYRTMIAAYRAGLPGAWVICAHIQPHDSASGLVNPYNAQIDAVVAALADPKIIVSTTVHDIVKASGLVGYHPNVADGLLWAAGMAGDINAVLGPWSGSIATTETSDTLTAAGIGIIRGTLARTETRDTLAASSGTACHGSMAVHEHHDRLVTRKRRHPRWFPGLARRPRIRIEDKERVS